MVEKRLIFKGYMDSKGRMCFDVHNKKDEQLGTIRKQRVGRFMQWAFLPCEVRKLGDMWFTNGCMKEISSMLTQLWHNNRK